MQMNYQQKCPVIWHNGHCWIGGRNQKIFEVWVVKWTSLLVFLLNRPLKASCSELNLLLPYPSGGEQNYQQCCGTHSECGESFNTNSSDVVMWRESKKYLDVCLPPHLQLPQSTGPSAFDVIQFFHILAYTGWGISLATLVPSVLIGVCFTFGLIFFCFKLYNRISHFEPS